ncbi:MAG: Eco57I restriction-modification methylase domain-containing protein [Bacteroidales bacterium]|nr:Eco57I restriction-modification methylase domain-containing protein [Bacteroidales bacterium]
MKYDLTFSKICDKSGKEFLSKKNKLQKRDKGQIFTPISIAFFMAKQFIPLKGQKEFSVLDPGAGSGILTAAFCDYIFNETNANVKATLYEKDKEIISNLNANMLEIAKWFLSKNRVFSYEIISKDFILDNYEMLDKKKGIYDFIISNPPYFKLSKKNKLVKLMKPIINGQPNIYFLFMAIAAVLANSHGQLTFITPRSFCSGNYFGCFRRWFLTRINIHKIHIFNSRKENFDDVLQETIIVSAQKKITNHIRISSSNNAQFSDYQEISVPKDYIIANQNDYVIRIPTSTKEVEIIRLMNLFPCQLSDLGVKISTGPVVDFRSKSYLKSKITTSQEVPLLWMHNIEDFRVNVNFAKEGKPAAIKISADTIKILRPIGNYVLLKRFTSKEQKRRLSAGILEQQVINKYKFIGIENHLNYLWSPSSNLNLHMAYGLLVLLNSTIYDSYFRIINGNTQVNASDINMLKFPNKLLVSNLGQEVMKNKEINYTEIDNLVEAVIFNSAENNL